MASVRPGRALGSVRGSYLVALAVLAAGLSLTALCYRVIRDNEAAARQARFTLYATQVTNTVTARFAQYLSVLDGSAGVFVAARRVRRADWQKFADTISLQSKYPGISSLEYLAYVQQEDLRRFLTETRADDAPGFTLTPEGARGFYCPITYNVPWERGVEGYDPCKMSRAGTDVLFRARDSGRSEERRVGK